MLKNTQIVQAQPKSRDYKLTDFEGLCLLVRPTGAKLWRLNYRFAGKQKSLALGAYPTVTLADARERRDAARKLLANGTDPSVKRRLEKIAAAAGGSTFRDVAEELLAKQIREGCAEMTAKKNRWLLEPAIQAFGARPIGEVTAPELLYALRKFENRGRFESARRMRTVAGMVFRYAIATGRATRDISLDLRGALTAPKTKHRAAITAPVQVGGLLRAIDSYVGQPTTRLALQLAALVFVRPGELRHARWQEIDIAGSVWNIPAETMKMDRPHRVPLARQSVSIIRDLHKITGGGEFLFPAITSVRRPMSENTLNAALRRLGYGKDEATAHGFRTTASTLLNEMGRWSRDAIERQLAHQEENEVRRAYMHSAEFWAERVEMMQAWADHLDQLRSGAEIITLKSVEFLRS
ncbi:MAG: tyrosine-type recombinase/integrase [Pseudolabrys sp.]|nr:tyrosine-type recombinase/integrase [Pseudolabrys sp.]MDP2298308.1 tyrosine-type recombinase/integrase [Pseudolabrys sp.]